MLVLLIMTIASLQKRLFLLTNHSELYKQCSSQLDFQKLSHTSYHKKKGKKKEEKEYVHLFLTRIILNELFTKMPFKQLA